MFFLWNALNVGLLIASAIAINNNNMKSGVIYGVIGGISLLLSILYYYRRQLMKNNADSTMGVCIDSLDCLACDMNQKNGFDCVDIECGKMQILEIDCDGVECMNADCCSL
ncbi:MULTISPECIES: hypothetical protein [Bacillus]|uniref:Transmembrane protein n=2 Tax=Bacillus thuringiensis TaxID=1428 RepID=A0A9X6VCM1_BACTU|nr:MULTISPECIES: hypothetical protein [Bacillus]MEC0046416.1 hypothetical protein [Bacillus cereus]HDR7922474.1 hypothetical protein [Bacillus paranthracis]AFV21781.1 hypothetical protein BTB_502p04760 [Bacillus thuringiensis Bt407]EEM25192.1 hypothetical protein bthur0002_58340 [Bacillus thuringiensis Bt407]ERI01043.1 hypothetical protein BTCBT_002598 [Bacillus thuringiensis T01-328]